NAAISRLMGLTNALSSATMRVVQHSVEFEEALAALVMMTAPMAPHLASELWAATYPIYSSINSYPQINNKACGTVTVPLQVSKDSERVQQLILESPLGQKLLGERNIKRAILSPRTALINFLIDE
ncbi:putative leucine--tRNA ligase, partial [Nibea albiflora]